MHVPDKSVEPAAFSYSNARGARIVERRQRRFAVLSLGVGHLSRASAIAVRICDENSALAPDTALEAMEAAALSAQPVPCARMKDGVILRVSKPARMGIDDSGINALRPPIQHKLFSPQAQSCSGPSPDN